MCLQTQTLTQTATGSLSVHGHAGQAGGLSGQGGWATGIRGSEHSQRQARNFELRSQARAGSVPCKLLGHYKQLQSHSDYCTVLVFSESTSFSGAANLVDLIAMQIDTERRTARSTSCS